MILIFIALILIAFWNGYVVKWGVTGDQQANKIWHKLGFVIRLLLFVMVLHHFYPNWHEMLRFGSIALFLSHPIYNGIINWINGHSWDYLGEIAQSDIWMQDFYHWIVVGEIILIVVAWII